MMVPARRTDEASRVVLASPDAVFRAMLDPAAVARWLPPEGMTGHVEAFEPWPGGAFRIVLTYDHGPGDVRGKTSEASDRVVGRFADIEAGRLVVQETEFASPDPAFAGTMRIVWTIDEVPEGARVRVRCEGVPEGVGQKDHEAGLNSTLANLARHVE